MAVWTGDLSDQIIEKIALEGNFSIARVAMRIAEETYYEQEKKPGAKSKREIFDRVAKTFMAVLGPEKTDVSVVEHDGRLFIQVGTVVWR